MTTTTPIPTPVNDRVGAVLARLRPLQLAPPNRAELRQATRDVVRCLRAARARDRLLWQRDGVTEIGAAAQQRRLADVLAALWQMRRWTEAHE